MLQRIYGTAYPTQAELEIHLVRLEEAKKRDHRRLGKELGLFTFSEDIGSGIPLFYPKGSSCGGRWRPTSANVQTRYGYQHCGRDHIVERGPVPQSGHLDNYLEVMFPA